MRSVFRLMGIIMLTVVFTACNNNNPEVTAVKFTKALYTADSDKAMSFCTKDSRPAVSMILSMASKYLEEFKASNPKVEVISSEISEDGTTATVDLRIKDYYDIMEHKITDKINEETVNLKKIDDEWKVVITK